MHFPLQRCQLPRATLYYFSMEKISVIHFSGHSQRNLLHLSGHIVYSTSSYRWTVLQVIAGKPKTLRSP